MDRPKGVEISVVVPVFNEEGLIAEFAHSLFTVLEDEPETFEILFVDDGSTDSTWEKVCRVASTLSAVRGLRLARNYGKEIALYAGLDSARGRAHIPIDVDFQDPPELIPLMIQRWRRGIQHVIPIRLEREDGAIRSRASRLFHKLTQERLKPGLRGDVGDFRLMDADVTSRFLQMKETRRYNKGLFSELGGTTDLLEFVRPRSRRDGMPRQSLQKLFDLGQVAAFQSSAQFLRRVTLASGVMAAVLVLLIPASAVLWVLGVISVPGQATTIVLGLLILVVQIASFSLLALLLGDISIEVKDRPLYFIEKET